MIKCIQFEKMYTACARIHFFALNTFYCSNLYIFWQFQFTDILFWKPKYYLLKFLQHDCQRN